MSELSSRIEAILRDRYPDGAVPRGQQKVIAAEVDVSGEFVRQTMVRLGMQIVLKPKRMRGRCRECGGPRRLQDTYCESCQFVDLACACCGKAIRRRRA